MSVFRPVFHPVMRRVFQPAVGFADSSLPMAGLLAWCANRFDPEQLAFIDKIGGSVRPLHDLQYIQADGTGYFVNADLVTASTTVTSVIGSGTTTYSSPSAGRINMTSGTAWDFTVTWSDAVESEYAYCSLVTDTYGVCFDRSGNGRHLVATGFADLSLVCLSGKEYGSDVLNTDGYSDGGIGVERIINGTFDTDSGWTKSGSAIISNGVLSLGSSSSYASQNFVTSASNEYYYSFEIVSVVGGASRIQLQDNGTNTYYNNTDIHPGVYSGTFTASSVNSVRIILVTADRVVVIDNISIKQSYPSTVPIPASTTPGIDALGNALTYHGRSKYNLLPKSAPCVAFDGTGYLAVKKDGVAYTLTGSTIQNGGTATLAISTSSITCAGTGTGFNIRITESGGNVITFPCSEGQGTTVFGYDTQGNNYTGTCTGFLGAIWSTQSEYFHGLTYGASIGRWSPLDQAYKDEPTRTNKCTCVKANPTSTTNITKNGDAAATLTVVDDYAALADAGLDLVCSSGMVYKLDNSGGSSIATALLSGLTGNVNIHSISIYARSLLATTSFIRLLNGGSTPYIHSSMYTKIKAENQTPSTSSEQLIVRAIAGDTIYFILPQLEEGSTATSPIIGTDTAEAQTEVNANWPANSYNTGYDCRGHALANPPLKWNDSAYYTMPDADQIREALGWTYGTASDEYDADGTPLEKTLAELETLGVGPRFYFGSKGLAIYDTDQTTTDAKIKSVVGV